MDDIHLIGEGGSWYSICREPFGTIYSNWFIEHTGVCEVQAVEKKHIICSQH